MKDPNSKALSNTGKWLSTRGLMPGYGQVFYLPNTGRVWYVGGDGDDNGFGKLVEARLKSIPGVREVTYEAEGFPPRGKGWVQAYPRSKVHNTWTPISGFVVHGGPGSGDFGHPGRPGEVGGSGGGEAREAIAAARGKSSGPGKAKAPSSAGKSGAGAKTKAAKVEAHPPAAPAGSAPASSSSGGYHDEGHRDLGITPHGKERDEVDKTLNSPEVRGALKVPEFMYHVTSAANLDSILKGGLKFGAPRASATGEIRGVYLTDSTHDISKQGGDIGGGKTVTLKISTKGLNLRLDPEYFYYDDKSAKGGRAYVDLINKGEESYALYSPHSIPPVTFRSRRAEHTTCPAGNPLPPRSWPSTAIPRDTINTRAEGAARPRLSARTQDRLSSGRCRPIRRLAREQGTRFRMPLLGVSFAPH